MTVLPSLTGTSAFFWTSGRDGVLQVRWCAACAEHLHPSAELCPRCLTADLGEVAVSGAATVVAVTVNEHAWVPDLVTPYVVVVVTLDDAPTVRLTSRLVGCEPSQARIGLAVQVDFEQHDDVWLPVFAPTGAADRPVDLAPPAVPAARAAGERFEHRVALTGIGASEVGRRLGRSELDLTVEACHRAVADAGLALSDVDGLVAYPGSVGMPGVSAGGVRALEQALGLQPTWHCGAQETPGQLGGIVSAMHAVSAGLCRHVLCWTSVRRDQLPSTAPTVDGRITGEAQWRVPFGATSPAHWIALAASHYLHRFGADRSALGWLAVSARQHAQRNPAALVTAPLDLDAYLAQRTITTPFGLADCDVPCDGAYAVVVSAVDAARDLPQPPVRVDAVGTRITEAQSWDQGTLTHQPNVFGQAAHLWSRSSLTPADVDVAALYDGFTFNALTWLEALGFCAVGEGAAFVEGAKRIGPDGELPLNPHGGQLTAGRSNGFGSLHEAVAQLRRQAGARQVQDAEVAVVSSGGGIPGGCLLLTVDR